jgi:RimJ/RimL family protein N-acetyltransferase
VARLPRSAPTLTGGQVALRAHWDEDVDRIVEQGRDPLMQQWTGVPARYARKHARAFLASRPAGWQDGTELGFAITHRGEFAGSVDLRPQGAGAAEVGYALHPDARGRHVGSTALRLCLAWAFQSLDLEVVHWRAAVGNWPSRRLAWAVGFQVEGAVRGLLAARDARRDAWVGSLRRGEPMTPAHLWLDPVTITGRRVRLRAHRADDLARTVEACNDPGVHRWLSQIPKPYRAEDAAAHQASILEDHAAGRALYWAVAGGDDLMVGEIGLFGLRAGLSRAGEIGYWVHPEHRGRSVATEAVRLAARHALLAREDGGLGLARVLVRAADDNVGSQRVALRAGFRPSGRDRASELLGDGTVHDALRFDLVADELDPATDHDLPAALVHPRPERRPAARLAAGGRAAENQDARTRRKTRKEP